MAEQNNNLLFDNRLIQLNQRLGKLDAKTWENHITKLTDVANLGEEFVMFTEEAEDGADQPTFAALESK